MNNLLHHPIRPDSALAAEFWEAGRSASCPIYDMHGHMGPFGPIYFPCETPEAMLRHMESAGVELLCFAPHSSLMSPMTGNTESVAAVRRYPRHFRAYMAINPNYPDLAAADLARIDEWRDVFVGFKFLSDYHGQPLSHDAYRPALEFADSRRLLVLMHTWSGSPCDGPAEVRKVAARYPNAIFLLGHSFNNHWHEAIAVAREFPNTNLELTSVLGLRGVIERLVEGVGSGRLIFGTDLPWFSEHQGIGSLLSCDISEGDIHNILHRNAEKLLAGAG